MRAWDAKAALHLGCCAVATCTLRCFMRLTQGSGTGGESGIDPSVRNETRGDRGRATGPSRTLARSLMRRSSATTAASASWTSVLWSSI